MVQIQRLLCRCLALSVLIYATELPSRAANAENITVLLFQAQTDSDCIYLRGPFLVTQPHPMQFAEGLYKISKHSNAFEIQTLNKTQLPQRIRTASLTISPPGAGGALAIGRVQKNLRRYHGKINLSVNKSNTLECRNLVSRRNYVESVVGSESPPKFPIESLKALSVLIQNSMHRLPPAAELNDTTEKQAYLGIDYARSEVLSAVQQTWGDKLVCKNQLILPYFHSTCAGGTCSSQIFTGKQATMSCDRGVECHHCKDSPFYKETISKVSANKFENALGKELPKVINKDKSGRPLELLYPNGRKIMAYQLWMEMGQKLGWGVAPGTRFRIEKTDNANYKIHSTGAGHGVGLCQWGSQGLARKQWTYNKILEYYFPGAQVQKGK